MRERKFKSLRMLIILTMVMSVLFISGVSAQAREINVYIKNTTKGVELNWDEMNGTIYYTVFRLDDGKWVDIKDTKKTKFVDTTAKSGKVYTYKIKSWHKKGYGKRHIAEIMYLKSPVTTLKSTCDGVNISWSSVTAAKKYYVYRKQNGAWKRIGETVELTYKDSNVKNGNKYRYRVRAVSDTYKSGWQYKEIKYKRHAYEVAGKIEAKANTGGITTYKCKRCGYEKSVRVAPTGIGKYRFAVFKTMLKEALKYEKKTPSYTVYDKASKNPVNTIKTPRYWKDPDGIYRSSTVKEDGIATICFTGDIMCQPKQQDAAYNKYGKYQFLDAFVNVKDTLKSADFTIGNLEATTRDNVTYARAKSKIDGSVHLNAPSTLIGAIRYGGFDMVAMANNHNCDAGVQGIYETICHVEQYGLIHTGTFRTENEKRYVIVEIDGIKVAFLSYSTIYNGKDKNLTSKGRSILLNPYSEETAIKDIKAAKAEGAEYVIPYIHFGIEYTRQVTDNQKRIFQELADAGADYIIGSHPHVLQHYTVITSKDGRKVPGVYSMGNFVSSMQKTEARQTAIILRIKLKKNENGKVQLLSDGYIPVRTYGSLKGMKYTTVPLTKPYNKCGLGTVSDIDDIYDEITSVMGSRISVLGTFKK